MKGEENMAKQIIYHGSYCKVENPEIYNYITDLMSGQITREAFWELAKFRHPTHQIAFCTDTALGCLKFVKSEEF